VFRETSNFVAFETRGRKVCQERGEGDVGIVINVGGKKKKKRRSGEPNISVEKKARKTEGLEKKKGNSGLF